MDTFYLFLCFILLLAILYLALNIKFSRLLEQKFNSIYRQKIQTDIQDFYREMESYSALLENRINRFKKLIERQEQNNDRWQKIFDDIKKSKKGKQISEYIDNAVKNEKQLLQAIHSVKNDSENIIKSIDNTESKNVIPKGDKKKPPLIKTNAQKQEKIIPPKPVTPKVLPYQTDNKLPSKMQDNETTIAEELLFDMDRNEKPNVPSQPQNKELLTDTQPSIEKGGGTLVNVLSKIGRTISPSVFGSQEHIQQKSVESNDMTPQFSTMLQAHEKKDIRKPSTTHNQTKPETSLSINLSPEEVMQTLSDLQSQSKRPMALKMLLKNGYSLNKISEMAELPMSELEATRAIYELG